MDNKNMKSPVCRILLLAEHLYMETNQHNPVTLAELQKMLSAHGFDVDVQGIRKMIKVLANEMGYPVGEVRIQRIGAPKGYYWGV